MLNPGTSQSDDKDNVVIKKYANRRLYNTQTSTYVTLDDLADLVRANTDFVVFDAKSGDDLTHAVLTQIIVDQEGKKDGRTLLPVPFLRQLIRFYDDQIGKMVPSYLQFSLENLVKEQDKLRSHLSNTFANPGSKPAATFEVYQDMARQNMAMFEQAMAMWSSFGAAAQSGGKPDGSILSKQTDVSASTTSNTPASKPTQDNGDLNELRQQLEAMQQKIDHITRDQD